MFVSPCLTSNRFFPIPTVSAFVTVCFLGHYCQLSLCFWSLSSCSVAHKLLPVNLPKVIMYFLAGKLFMDVPIETQVVIA